MAISFKNTKGKAVSNKVDSYKYKDGDNSVRLVGGILPRYVYWVNNGKNDVPIECLAFDRESERFNNAEPDYVQTAFPELKCQWSYAVNCIDPADGKVKVLNLKKKLFESILTTAEDLGDPTDPDEGWDVVFKKVKTGPHAFNVEYQLKPLSCKKRALTEAEKTAIAEAKTIDQWYPRPTPEEVRGLVDRILSNTEEEENTNDNTDSEAVNEL